MGPPLGGKVKRTPGVKRTKRRAGTMRSAGVIVNLKTKWMMSHDKRATTKAWNITCIKSPELGGRLSKSPGLKRAKSMVGTRTFGPVMSIICNKLTYYVSAREGYGSRPLRGRFKEPANSAEPTRETGLPRPDRRLSRCLTFRSINACASAWGR